MKKIVSLLLVLILALTSALAVNAAEQNPRGTYTNNVTNTNVTVTTLNDNQLASKNVDFFNMSKGTLVSVTPDSSSYEIGTWDLNDSNGTTYYYISKYNGQNCYGRVNANQADTAVYDNVCTLHYENVGQLSTGELIDLDIHLDKLIVTQGYTHVPGACFMTVATRFGSSAPGVSQCVASNIDRANGVASTQAQIFGKYTATPKYHGTNTVVTGKKFVFVADDLDYGSSTYPKPESFATGSGFDNEYWVYNSCRLVAQDTADTDGCECGYVRWHAPSSGTGADGVSGNNEYLVCGVYALTDGTGSFTYTIGSMSYGTVIHLSPDASTISSKYTVDYDPNGGEFSGGLTTAKIDSDYIATATVTVRGNTGDSGFIPTRTGYTFNGWNTAADGSGTARAAGSTFSMPAEDVTLYAQWTVNDAQLPDPPYILYYDRNTLLKKIKITDTSATHTITADPIATGAESGLTGIVDGLPTREGWLFAGWYTSAPAAVGRTAGDAYPRSFTISTYQSSASDNVELYAGWVPVSSVTIDANDEKNYGVGMTTLGGFSMQGVQVRSPELAEIYQPENKNTVNPGIRFVTVYNKTMLNQLGSLKPQAFTRADGDIPVYESGAVRYGYVLTANLTGLTDLKWNSSNVIKTDCTKSDHNRDHRNFGSYILSTTVIKFDDSGDISNYGSRLFEARAFVTYTDCNGYQRVRYSTYDSSKFAGGCRTCYNDANAWAQLHRV